MNLISTRKQAFDLLDSLGAPKHLLMHVSLVGEAADLILNKLEQVGVKIDFDFVRIGVAIHDAGKIVHTHEMTGPGSDHEPEGQKILLENGVSEKIARCCMSHARWRNMDCSIEELLVALSDKLWKGNRVESLELEVIDRVANLIGKERWDIFADLDSHFELIAAGGHDRLNRSISS